ncbi:MAG TPA: DUF932 domain-containing protein [Rugosimonospora sp.]|nr:DUF932 domain-containing protein [Rugosimonospora sp.]
MIDRAVSTVSDLGARNANLSDLAEVLQRRYARRQDIVASARSIHAVDGNLIVDRAGDPIITDDGVTSPAAEFVPTEVCDEGIAAKLDIPLRYLRRMRRDNIGLYDKNVNGWLESDTRKFMVRCLRASDGGPGVARALVSDRYGIIDDFDVLTAALDGVRQADVRAEVESCDLTDRRMYLRITCDGIRVMAPALLAGYRSPFTGETGADNPVISAGAIIGNSEVGSGAFTITPSLRVRVCRNGVTITRDARRYVHLGHRMDEGEIEWSADTLRKCLDVITGKARDSIAAFVTREYAERALREIEGQAGRPVEQPDETITTVCKRLKISDEHRAGILNHFIRGGAVTAGGVLHAVTSFAQTLPNADDAYAMEAQGLEAMRIAAGA